MDVTLLSTNLGEQKVVGDVVQDNNTFKRGGWDALILELVMGTFSHLLRWSFVGLG